MSGPIHHCGSDGCAIFASRSRSAMRTLATSNAAAKDVVVPMPFWKNASPKAVDSPALPQPGDACPARDDVTISVLSSCSGSMNPPE